MACRRGPFYMPNLIPSVQRVAPAGRKPQNRPLSKLNTGTFALRAMLPVKIRQLRTIAQICRAISSQIRHVLCSVISIFFLSSFFLSFFLSSPNLSGRRLDVYHTWCGLSANLRRRSETWCTGLAANTGRKMSSKIAIWAP